MKIYCFFFFFLLLLSSAYGSERQDSLLPFNPQIDKGKLTNGLTWYIKPNAVPEKKIHFRLVVNAGSTSESETQQGLAHFLEHMAFKGSDSFPPGTLIKELEDAGVKLGRDLNARTTTDETVYYLTIASDKYRLGLRVLRDWAGGLLLDSAMIEQERGVIIEELRLGKGARTRLREQYYPVLLGTSIYPWRFVIGKEEVIATFPRQELKKFYADCYRPERMAIVVIGDLDPLLMRQEIEKNFGTIKSGKHPMALPDVSIPEHPDLKVAVVTDPEATESTVQLFYKHKPLPLKSQEDFKKYICNSLYSSVLDMRLAELAEAGSAPFTEAESGYSSFNRGCDVYSGFAKAVPGREMQALESLLTEDRRMLLHGVSASELKRAKRKIAARYERRYADREKTPSSAIADECQVDFLHPETAMGIEYEYRLLNRLLPTIGTGEINVLCKDYFTDSNRVVVITAPEKESVASSSEKQICQIFKAVGKSFPAPYQDGDLPEELVSVEPVAGKMVSGSRNEKNGITEWRLDNGIRVLLKPTDFNNTVIFKAAGDGGTSVFPNTYDPSAFFATEIQDRSGVGGMGISRLRKILSGCNVSVSQTIGMYEQSMSGYFSAPDIDEFFQMLYLYHTSPYFDSTAFQRFRTELEAGCKTGREEPERFFTAQVDSVMNVANPRVFVKNTEETVAALSPEKAEEVYRRLFSDPAGMTYVFAGKFTPEEIKPRVLAWLGGIPAVSGEIKQSIPQNLSYPIGPAEYIFHKGQEDKVSVEMRFVKRADWDEYKSYCLNIFSEILSSRLFKSLREEMGGVYGVRLSDRVNKGHDRYAFFDVSFGTNMKMWRAVCRRAVDETKRLLAEGPAEEELARVKEKRKQSYMVNARDNRVWASQMLEAACYGRNLNNFINRAEIIDNLTIQDVKSAGEYYLDTDTILTFVLLPENEDANTP